MDNILQALVEIFIILVGFVFVFVGIVVKGYNHTAFKVTYYLLMFPLLLCLLHLL